MPVDCSDTLVAPAQNFVEYDRDARVWLGWVQWQLQEELAAVGPVTGPLEHGHEAAVGCHGRRLVGEGGIRPRPIRDCA